MGSLDAISIALSFIGLIPLAVFAIFVEKHYVQYYNAFWNVFAFILSSIGSAIWASENGNISGLSIALLFAIAGIGLLYFTYEGDIDGETLKTIGSSRVMLSASLFIFIFCYFDNFLLAVGMGVVAFIITLILSQTDL